MSEYEMLLDNKKRLLKHIEDRLENIRIYADLKKIVDETNGETRYGIQFVRMINSLTEILDTAYLWVDREGVLTQAGYMPNKTKEDLELNRESIARIVREHVFPEGATGRSEHRGSSITFNRHPTATAQISRLPAGQIARKIWANTEPAAVFVDARDFSNLSLAQKNEYLYAVLSESQLRVVVYNENGQVKDRELEALLKLDRVMRTDRDLSGALSVFARPNSPNLHLSKTVLPPEALVRASNLAALD